MISFWVGGKVQLIDSWGSQGSDVIQDRPIWVKEGVRGCGSGVIGAGNRSWAVEGWLHAKIVSYSINIEYDVQFHQNSKYQGRSIPRLLQIFFSQRTRNYPQTLSHFQLIVQRLTSIWLNSYVQSHQKAPECLWSPNFRYCCVQVEINDSCEFVEIPEFGVCLVKIYFQLMSVIKYLVNGFVKKGPPERP